MDGVSAAHGAPILALAISMSFSQHPLSEMLTFRKVSPWNRIRGGWWWSGQRTSRNLSSVACLNRSTRSLSKSVSTENILARNCCKQKTKSM